MPASRLSLGGRRTSGRVRVSRGTTAAVTGCSELTRHLPVRPSTSSIDWSAFLARPNSRENEKPGNLSHALPCFAAHRCEANWVYSPYIAEAFNTLSNIAFGALRAFRPRVARSRADRETDADSRCSCCTHLVIEQQSHSRHTEYINPSNNVFLDGSSSHTSLSSSLA